MSINWLEYSDEDVLELVEPIMDSLMQASTDRDYKAHVHYFSESLKSIVTEDSFLQQCEEYQSTLGYFEKRELVGIFRKRGDIRVFWKQFYSHSEDEFVAYIAVHEREGTLEVINVSVS